MALSDPPPENFGRRLKRLAKERGYTNRALAKLTGAHEVTVSRWMGGTEPELDTLLMLVKLLGVTLDELRKGPQKKKAATFKKETKRRFQPGAKKRRKGSDDRT